MNPTLNIVTTIDLARRPRTLLIYAKNFVETLEKTPFKILIGYNRRTSTSDDYFIDLISTKKNVNLVTGSKKHTSVNNAYLRNIATLSSKSDYILFIDIDIIPDVKLIEKMLLSTSRKNKKFTMAPCLYLNKLGTSNLLGNRVNRTDIIDSYMSFSRKYTQHLAIPSSIILLQKNDFLDVGGYDEEYIGHGYEDFDLITKISHHLDIIKINDDSIYDQAYTAPLLSKGFRANLAALTFDMLLEKDIFFHCFHPSNKDNYYRMRTKNAKKYLRLLENLRDSSDVSTKSSTEELIGIFFINCKNKNIDPEQFYILFDARPGHMSRYNTLRRKINAFLEILKS